MASVESSTAVHELHTLVNSNNLEAYNSFVEKYDDSNELANLTGLTELLSATSELITELPSCEFYCIKLFNHVEEKHPAESRKVVYGPLVELCERVRWNSVKDVVLVRAAIALDVGSRPPFTDEMWMSMVKKSSPKVESCIDTMYVKDMQDVSDSDEAQTPISTEDHEYCDKLFGVRTLSC